MIEVRGWRIASGEPSGLTMWFDPLHEQPLLRVLTREEKAVSLDEYGSVSALGEGEASGVSIGSQLQLPLAFEPGAPSE